MNLGSSSGMSSAAVHGRIPVRRQDADCSVQVMQRYVNPGVVFQDAARHGRDEFDLNVATEHRFLLMMTCKMLRSKKNTTPLI
ncbi:hypothetical protein ZWY2020_057291 [Hordeum vulgare]|nr:hypothetical protein ZWY2020_057291 [Hordeum vulgare]